MSALPGSAPGPATALFQSPELLAASSREKGVTALLARHATPSDRPALRSNLIARRQVQMGEVRIIIKNQENGKFYYVNEVAWALLLMFNGKRTRQEVMTEFNKINPWAHLNLNTVLAYEDYARRMDLIVESTPERSLKLLSELKNARQRAAEEKAEGFNPFFMMFQVVDPDRFLNRTVKYVRWIWSPPAVAVFSVGLALTVGVFAQHFDTLLRETLETYAFLRKPLWEFVQFWIVVSAVSAIHELGHAYACKIYGGEVHNMGIALLYFMPAFYTNTTDQLLFTKWQRLWVTIAGIYLEGLLCMAGTFLWVATYPDTLAHDIAYKTMLYAGLAAVFFNINPLMKIDGYHALTSMLQMPELREEAFGYLGALFQNKILRLNVPVKVFTRRKLLVIWIYGPLALIYVGFIMSFISHLFYNFYSKVWPNLAIPLLILTVLRLFRKRVRLVVRVAKLFYLDKKEFLMSSRARAYMAGLGAGLLVLLAIPWTRQTVQANVSLRPVTSDRVESPENGTVVGVFVQNGDAVRKGTEIASLESGTLKASLSGLKAQEQGLLKEASRDRELSKASAAFRAGRQETAVEADIRKEEARTNGLVVRAPLAGRVLTPRMEDLVGRFVRSGDLLAEIGDCRRLIAEIPVTERLVSDLSVGQAVSLRVLGRPLEVLHGSLVSISPAALALPETARTLKASARPPEKPEKFVAVARFENPEGSLLPGMSGSAKIYVQRASYLSRSWRVLRDWLQTVIWW